MQYNGSISIRFSGNSEAKASKLPENHTKTNELYVYIFFYFRLFSRMCLDRGLAIVTVGAPATPLITCRARLCLSASHDKEFLDKVKKVHVLLLI